MSLFYEIVYRLGFTPWERMQTLPVGQQAARMLDREQDGAEPPYGPALDLGCGTGIWSVDLAARGWQVTGVEVVPKAARAARERAREAGVEVRFLEGDVTALRAAGVGSGFRLVLDFGTVHGLTKAQREAVGREVSAVAAPDCILLMYAMAPGRRGPLPRGMSRNDVEATYPAWSVIDGEAFDVSGTPRPMRKSNPRWYRLRRN
jgi:SAM-dependent methyltransferase